MNDLLFRSFSGGRVADIEMASAAADATNLEKFFEDAAAIKEELKGLENLHNQLQQSNEEIKTLYNANSIKTHRKKMDNEDALSLQKANLIKNRLETLDRSTDANRSLAGCGTGSSTDRARVAVVNSLRKQLQSSMKSFTELHRKMATEHRETVKRRYYSVTGENADETTVDDLIATGKSETFLQKAIQEQGRWQAMEIIVEIEERHDAVTEIERNLKDLHQVFTDMAVMVEVQGEQMDDIESNVKRANSFVRGGAEQLVVAKKTQLNARKWICFGSILLLIINAIIVLAIRPWK